MCRAYGSRCRRECRSSSRPPTDITAIGWRWGKSPSPSQNSRPRSTTSSGNCHGQSHCKNRFRRPTRSSASWRRTDNVGANPAADRRPTVQDPSPAHRAVSPLVERLHLLVLCVDRDSGGDALAARRRADELLRLLSADPGVVLSVVDDQRELLDFRHPAADFVLDRATSRSPFPPSSLLRWINKH